MPRRKTPIGTTLRPSLTAVLRVIEAHGPLADFQLAAFFPAGGQMPQSARRRRRELTEMGYVVRKGTVKSPTNKNVPTYRGI